ncbi:MAG: folylpolyglutamate synthase/dihydrofolate synthase family protein [Microbacteriaceae bacterium]|nr:folylpolyglutamate synthase/dihydrofolate synthase family protein [Microbacteriaceae bacterium]MDR9443617.1 folylpolyglutamate synthase/dihydrofolate synthase family protein [Microbacteriaceae bacterium]
MIRKSALNWKNLSEDGFSRAYQEILARVGEAKPTPDLYPVELASELLGDPQFAYPVIHITGTNGKTSTARIIERILREHGLRTGRFTSPHLVDITERISIDGEPLEKDLFEEYWDQISPILEIADAKLESNGLPKITFFEAITLLAFQAFADAPVDVAIIEVGMGGEWDATNVVNAEVTVFSQIALDHTKQLGSTVSEVAKTKSGIIKPDSIVVSQKQTPEAEFQLKNKLLDGQKIIFEDIDYKIVSQKPENGGYRFSSETALVGYQNLFLPLAGEHQLRNAMLAVSACEAFLGGGNKALSEPILHSALADATSPGRLQVFRKKPLTILDAAHNPAGIKSLTDALVDYFEIEKCVVVLGTMADKDYPKMLEILKPLISSLVITQAESERAVQTSELAEAASLLGLEVQEIEGSELALEYATDIALEEGLPVVVTGSILLLGEIINRERLEAEIEKD